VKTEEYTQNEINNFETMIEEMDHETMCYKWRFSPSGSPLFRKDLITSSGKSLGDIFKKRLFEHFGGFTPEISKSIGWE